MIKIDASEVRALQRRLQAVSKNIKRDEVAAVKKAAAGIVTEAIKVLRKTYTVNAKAAREKVLKPKVDISDLSFTVRALKKPITIRNYTSLVQKGFAVAAQPIKGGRGGRIRDSFAQSVKGGPVIGWVRTGFKMKTNPKRDAITPIFGPSMADAFNNKISGEAIADVGLSKMKIELERRIAKALNG